MNDFETKALALLTSIDASLKVIADISRKRVAANGPAVAPDRDLDSQYGDEKIRFDPRDWSGKRYKGCTMSESEPDYLELLAGAYDFFAEKNDREKEVDSAGRPKSTYDKRTAARARGWAKRMREGWKPPPPPPPMDDRGMDDAGMSDANEDFGGAESFGGAEDFGTSGGF